MPKTLVKLLRALGAFHPKKHWIWERRSTPHRLAEYLAQPGAVAAVDVGPVYAGICNGEDPEAVENMNKLKRRSGKRFGTMGDEHQVHNMVDFDKLNPKFRPLFDEEMLEMFRGVFVRFPCRSHIHDELHMNHSHQVWITDGHARNVQKVIRDHLKTIVGHEVPLLVATSYNRSLDPRGGAKHTHQAFRVTADLGTPVTVHRLVRHKGSRGSMAIFSFLGDDIRLERHGVGEQKIKERLEKLGFKVLE